MAGIDDEKPALEADGAFRVAPMTRAGTLRARIVLLPEARAEARGLVYAREGQSYLLPWSRVAAAHAAAVGEPEGVQTMVFDLALAGRPLERCRLDADPGDAARILGNALEGGIGRSRCSASLRAVALEGYATRSYADLDSYEDDLPQELSRAV